MFIVHKRRFKREILVCLISTSNLIKEGWQRFIPDNQSKQIKQKNFNQLSEIGISCMRGLLRIFALGLITIVYWLDRVHYTKQTLAFMNHRVM